MSALLAIGAFTHKSPWEIGSEFLQFIWRIYFPNAIEKSTSIAVFICNVLSDHLER